MIGSPYDQGTDSTKGFHMSDRASDHPPGEGWLRFAAFMLFIVDLLVIYGLVVYGARGRTA